MLQEYSQSVFKDFFQISCKVNRGKYPNKNICCRNLWNSVSNILKKNSGSVDSVNSKKFVKSRKKFWSFSFKLGRIYNLLFYFWTLHCHYATKLIIYNCKIKTTVDWGYNGSGVRMGVPFITNGTVVVLGTRRMI